MILTATPSCSSEVLNPIGASMSAQAQMSHAAGVQPLRCVVTRARGRWLASAGSSRRAGTAVGSSRRTAAAASSTPAAVHAAPLTCAAAAMTSTQHERAPVAAG
jgi:hypothetical protein